MAQVARARNRAARSREGAQKLGAGRSASKRVQLDAIARERIQKLIALLGNNTVAEMLGVSNSQPSRWARGREGMSWVNQRRIVDLDYVVTRWLQQWDPDLLSTWFTSHNPHLGAKPLDVLRLEGAAPLIAAIDASAEGAYA